MPDLTIGQRFYSAYVQSGRVQFYTTEIVAMSPKLIRVSARTPITNYREQNTVAQMEDRATSELEAVEHLHERLLDELRRHQAEVKELETDLRLVTQWGQG